MATAYGDEIVIQVSNNVLHQISSRVFGIIAQEILNYNVVYEDIRFSQQDSMQLNEKDKLFETLEQIRRYVKVVFFFTFIILTYFAFIYGDLFSVHVDQY